MIEPKTTAMSGVVNELTYEKKVATYMNAVSHGVAKLRSLEVGISGLESSFFSPSLPALSAAVL